MTRTIAIAAAAASMFATLAVPAYADPAKGESIEVSFSDLDLSTEKGQKALAYRVDRAARKVCGMDQTLTGSRIVNRESQACYAKVRSQTEVAIAQKVEGARLGG